MIKSFLKWILGLTLFATVFLVVLFLSILNFPNFFLNATSLKWAANQAYRVGLNIQWKTFDINIESQSLLSKEISLSASGVCVRDTDQSWHVCFDELSFETVIDLAHLSPRITQLGPLVFLKGDIGYQRSKSKTQATPKKSDSISSPIPDWIAQIDLRRFLVRVDRFDLDLGDTKVKGKFNLVTETTRDSATWSAAFQGHTESGTQRIPANVTLAVKSLKSQWKGPWQATGEVRGAIDPTLPMSLKLTVNQGKNSGVDYLIIAETRSKGYRVKGQISGTGSDSLVSAKINANLRTPLPEIREISLNDCQITLSKKPAKLELNCPIFANTNLPAPEARSKGGQTKGIEVIVRAAVETQFPPDLAAQQKGKVNVDLSSLNHEIIKGRGGIEIDFSGKLENFPKNLALKTKVDTGLEIKHFEKLVSWLQKSPTWAIPEPLNSLEGEISLTLKGDGTAPWEIKTLPIHLKTRLHSPEQRLDINAAADFSVQPSGKGFSSGLQAKVVLSEVTIQLPHLTLEAPPRFLPDPRIRSLAVRAPTKKQPESPFTFSLQVITAPHRPLKLVSNLAKEPIPISLNLLTGNTGSTDLSLKVERFALELFRRRAEIEYFTVSSTKQSDTMDINGEIKVNYVDYVVSIGILGTAEHPVVKFSSTPPLPQDQVMAVLLFGKPIDSLDDDQAESVDNARAAVANGAISLLSMYILASTPIESIGYNPTTGTFSAKVRIAEGTSFNVGASTSQIKQLGIRRRLGKNWSINTYLRDPFNTNPATSRTAGAFLEWNKRY